MSEKYEFSRVVADHYNLTEENPVNLKGELHLAVDMEVIETTEEHIASKFVVSCISGLTKRQTIQLIINIAKTLKLTPTDVSFAAFEYAKNDVRNEDVG